LNKEAIMEDTNSINKKATTFNAFKWDIESDILIEK
jgi:hypothetical protein